jgi:hypothetical protein
MIFDCIGCKRRLHVMSKNKYGYCRKCAPDVVNNDPDAHYTCHRCGGKWYKPKGMCYDCKADTVLYSSLLRYKRPTDRLIELHMMYESNLMKGLTVPSSFVRK